MSQQKAMDNLMNNLKAKRDERVALKDAYDAIANKAKEKSLSAEEHRTLEILDKQITGLAADIELLERVEKMKNKTVQNK